MTTKKIITAAIISTAMLTTGCASIVSDSQWPVSVTSTPNHAEYTIRNEDGVTVASGTTPNTVILSSGAGYFDGETYRIHYSKDGYGASDRTVDSSLNGWYFGNLLFGGVIGLAIVDPATGAMWKLPANAHADLSPVTAGIDPYNDPGEFITPARWELNQMAERP